MTILAIDFGGTQVKSALCFGGVCPLKRVYQRDHLHKP